MNQALGFQTRQTHWRSHTLHGVGIIAKARSSKPGWQSPSSINTYLTCPRKYYNRYIAKRPGEASIYLIRGCVVDRVLTQFYRFKINRASREMDYADLRQTVLSILTEEWNTHMDEFRELKLTDSDLAFYFHEAKIAVLHFLDWFANGGSGTAYTQPWVQKNIFNHSYRIRGRVDLIDRSPHPPLIVDWKVTKGKETTAQIKRQLVSYAFMYEEAFRVRPNVAAHFLLFKDGFRQFTVSDNAIESVKRVILETHQNTQSKDKSDYPCICGHCTDPEPASAEDSEVGDAA
ncbi:hypothetical protein GF406_23255 [candidate division KSB1 bacterium]|nr:hypothetical protein [candidate division KSB1 bacterium]